MLTYGYYLIPNVNCVCVTYLVLDCFKSFLLLMSYIFVTLYLNKYLFYCIVIDRKFCTLYIDAVHFFQILIFCLLSAYYYMMSLSGFRPIFLYEFKLNQSAAGTARKINQAFGNDRVNERTVH